MIQQAIEMSQKEEDERIKKEENEVADKIKEAESK